VEKGFIFLKKIYHEQDNYFKKIGAAILLLTKHAKTVWLVIFPNN